MDNERVHEGDILINTFGQISVFNDISTFVVYLMPKPLL